MSGKINELLERVNEGVKIETPMQNDKMSECINSLMSYSTQLKVWHLQSKSYPEHEALDRLYLGITCNLDRLSEVFIGSGGILRVDNVEPINLVNLEDANLLASCDEMLKKLDELSKYFTEIPHLKNRIDGIVEEFSQFKYRMGLK